ncbi:hypothetical protein KSF_101940 [Reticulibacter mediterranei]|uniref:Uncharacterized protein n=1 Tax=Reticulibacter mediterranei TaxID=2778369 RepID=A0A8J3J3N1_9CHLR|nr:hypothetical protein [Reticulibacter mediterranei]GHP00147.1 hypothetical protein KSF_101940 [Reticulibacter mediterranei]
MKRDFPTHHLLWEQAVAASGVPLYLGSPDDLKLLLMKAQNRKTPHYGYRVQNGNRLSFQGAGTYVLDSSSMMHTISRSNT